MLKADKDNSYARMIYKLALVAGLMASFLYSRTTSFNCGPLNSLVLFGFFLTPCAAFWVFIFGPSSWLRTIGICLTVPLSVASIILVAGAEWSDGSIEFAYHALTQGGFSDQVLRTYRDSGNGKVIGHGKILSNDLRLLQWSIGAFSSYQYRLELTRPIGSYCYELLKSVEIPPGCTPDLVTRPEGGYDLKVEDHSGREIFRADAMSVLDQKKQIPTN